MCGGIRWKTFEHETVELSLPSEKKLEMISQELATALEMVLLTKVFHSFIDLSELKYIRNMTLIC